MTEVLQRQPPHDCRVRSLVISEDDLDIISVRIVPKKKCGRRRVAAKAKRRMDKGKDGR